MRHTKIVATVGPATRSEEALTRMVRAGGLVVDDIAGVGPGRRRALLRHFGSMTGVKNASETELAAVPGVPAAVAHRVFEWLHREP